MKLSQAVYLQEIIASTSKIENLEAKDFSTKKRKKLAKTGAALPDGSFPIENTSDLSNAVQAIGRAKDYGKAKAHIIKRAKALGATHLLPDEWKKSVSAGGPGSGRKGSDAYAS